MRGWADDSSASKRAEYYSVQLELGNALFFPESPFRLKEEDLQFLLNVRQSSASYHKNISYRPSEDRIRGFDRKVIDAEVLRRIMRSYSQSASELVSTLLAPSYKVRLENASFRAIEEQDRKVRSVKNRNDLLHVDAFPTRPTNGDRILRLFTNIHPSKPRGWVVSEPFEIVAGQLALDAGLMSFARKRRSSFDFIGRAVRWMSRQVGARIADRSAYDRFMLSFHDYLKYNEAFQKNCQKFYWDFPPGSTWLVFTDMVPHSVSSGQFALEQTFIVSRHSLLRPDKAPVNILESMAGVPLTRTTSV
jgi:hypothetical protein